MSDWSAGPPRGRQSPRQGQGGYDYYRGFRDGEPQRRDAPPPPHPRRDGPPPRRPGGPPPRRKPKRWGRRIGLTLLVVVLLLAGLVLYVDSTLQRTPALADYPERVADTPGTNWLLVGTDSREGLDESQREELSAGDAAGRRTDTMMLMHIPAGGGQPALISLPRDSSVPIPGEGRGKLNSAFASGGPELLVQTVETVTEVRVDRYAEIGLGGFADLVDAVGGVNMCLEEPMQDPKAGIDLPAGCQDLAGPQALGFVRSREFADGDLERVANQRKLLSAIVDKATSPTTLLNPFRLVPMASAASKTFLVNDGDHVWHLASLAWAMGQVSGGSGVTTTVPIGGFGDGGTVEWDRESASMMFEAIANDTEIPPEVLSN